MKFSTDAARKIFELIGRSAIYGQYIDDRERNEFLPSFLL